VGGEARRALNEMVNLEKAEAKYSYIFVGDAGEIFHANRISGKR